MVVVNANSAPRVRRVGDLVLRRWMAQGGMAELYLASPADPARANEVVVLKRVLPQFSGRDAFVTMFAREARLATMFRHPNIVEVLDAGGLGAEDCYFTMEYVHGVDLGDLLDELRRRGGALPLAHALTIAVGICAGLHYAHEARDATGRPLGIVHRDVSPSNVLLGFDGAIKVTDFGVAKAMAMTRLTEEGTRKGKLAYMSPQQATGEELDRRADVFAIGTVLYELTTMQRLFAADNDLAIIYKLIHLPRPRPRDVNPSYPAALEAIVMQTLQHDPEQRFPTAQALQHALEAFAAEVGLELSPVELGAFVRQTMPVTVHPRDDPELLASALDPGMPQYAVTEVPGTDGGVTLAETLALATGPQTTVPLATGPHATVPLVTGPHATVPRVTGPQVTVPRVTGPQVTVASTAGHDPITGPLPGLMTVVAPTGAQPRVPPSQAAMSKWSLVLALLAVLIAGGVGAMVWLGRPEQAPVAAPAAGGNARDPAEPIPTQATPPRLDNAPPPTVEPSADDEPPPPAEPSARDQTPPAADQTPPTADEPEPTTGRRSKRRIKKRPPPKPPKPSKPPVEPASKKPSPTDTLLPIRE